LTLRYSTSWDNAQDSDAAAGLFSSAVISPATAVNIASTYSRWPTGKGLRLNVAGSFGSSTAQLQLTFDAQSTWIIGAAVKPLINSNNTVIFGLRSGGFQCELRFNGSAYYVARNGTGIATGGTVATTAFSHVEFKVAIHGTTGSYTVRINGTTYLTGSGVNTAGQGGTTADTVVFSAFGQNASGGYGGETQYDDLYIADGNSVGASPVNDFLGDCRPLHLLPNANGTFSDWAQTGGTAGQFYTAVNDTPNNGDTSYLSSGAVNQRTTLRYPALTSGTVRAVIVAPWIRKDDANVHTVSPRTYEGGTEQTGSASIQPTTTYASRQLIMETDPKDGAAWDLTRVNNSEIGLVLVS